MATSLGQIILFRVLQGLAGGGLQPSSQGVLLDAFPPERQGTAMTLFGMAALLAPVVGPTLGGYITDNYEWRWIFYLNVPVGLLALLMCSRLVVDPDYLVAQRAAARRQRQPFDLLGLVLLAVATIFLRNQVKSLRRLAAAADGFGKGHEVPFFKVEGAVEVRQAAIAFLKMRDRIQRAAEGVVDVALVVDDEDSSHHPATPAARRWPSCPRRVWTRCAAPRCGPARCAARSAGRAPCHLREW